MPFTLTYDGKKGITIQLEGVEKDIYDFFYKCYWIDMYFCSKQTITYWIVTVTDLGEMR